MSDHLFDAIVVGSGISGGWAAKELCEKGLKTLVLERGRSVTHGDYPTALKEPWDMPNGGVLSENEAYEYSQQLRGLQVNKFNKHFFVKDGDHNYEEKKPFYWVQGNQVGGKSITWGRKCYRLSDIDFDANLKEGIGVDWPIRYKDIEPWYGYVESFVGISGEKLGLPQIPDGNFLPPLELTCVEKHFRKAVMSRFGRHLTPSRTANLTKAIHGRGPCQMRNRCDRGCPYKGYFSSITSTLPAAEATGNLTIKANILVDSVIYDDKTQKASGVRVINTETMETTEYFARIIFLNASALNTAAIMLNSQSERFPNGIGNDSDQLGRNIMDHHFFVGASASIEGYEDRYYRGRSPGNLYIPRFRNIDEKSKRSDFVRGYGYQGDTLRANWLRGASQPGFGADFKENLMNPGEWEITILGFGETLPYQDNRITLDMQRKDKWGQPIKVIDAELKDNEYAMRKDMREQAGLMFESAGFKNIETFDKKSPVGAAIHEMGTARMGHDSKTSVLNRFNQVHAVKNLFVTDGACMASSACQNPSITYMALTARAVDFAVSEMKKNNL